MSKVTAVEAPEYKPSMYVDFPEVDAKQINDVELGKKVTFKITGKVVMVEKRMQADEKFASARIEDYRVEVIDSENVFVEMAEEDA